MSKTPGQESVTARALELHKALRLEGFESDKPVIEEFLLEERRRANFYRKALVEWCGESYVKGIEEKL